MAPSVSSKGKAKPQPKTSVPPRSRNTTPLASSTGRASVEPSSAAYLKAPMRSLTKDSDATLEELLSRGSSQSQIPSGATLNSMRESIQKRCLENARQRGDESDKLLRELQILRKDQRMALGRDRDGRTDISPKKEQDDRKQKLKKVKKREPDEHRPPAVGAHGMARQDGIDVHKASTSASTSPISQPPPSTGLADAASPDAMSDDNAHQPAPAAAVPQFQTFGPDPSTFDDPTVYDIRPVTEGMPEEEKKSIYCVAEYPISDLHDLTPGTPPDKDFSNAKPASQVSTTVFTNYVEPYIRALTEEDMAFLRERGDRITPFIMPRRGSRSYKQIWAEEDQILRNDNAALPPNEARGAYDEMNDDVLGTDLISAGPLVSRLLQVLRPEGRGNATEGNGSNANPDAMDIDEGAGAPADSTNNNSLPAAVQLPEFLQAGWKAPAAPPRTDYQSLEDRTMLELKHYGLVSDSDYDQAAYDERYDDEVAARLRLLQNELRKQSIVNGARKQRLLELTEERMAQQEYNTIADDLDNQLNAAYLKRNRNIGKGKKQTKRPGGAGGGSHAVPNAGISRPSVGEPIRTLMERKKMWNTTVGPVVNYGKTGLPPSTIFAEDQMKVLEDKEMEDWRNEMDE